jgi:hypothetical protein
MNIYRYIAENNPHDSYDLCMQHGDFPIESIEDLEIALESIVAMGEEKAIKVLELHPDKDVITEIFAKSVTPAEANKVVPQIIEVPKLIEVPKFIEKECSCNKLNATGDTPTQNHSIVTQTNTYILLGALIVSMAIISIKK